MFVSVQIRIEFLANPEFFKSCSEQPDRVALEGYILKQLLTLNTCGALIRYLILLFIIFIISFQFQEIRSCS